MTNDLLPSPGKATSKAPEFVAYILAAGEWIEASRGTRDDDSDGMSLEFAIGQPDGAKD